MKRANPIGTNVLIVPIEEKDRTTASGIIIPDTHRGGHVKGVVDAKGSGNRWNNMSEIKKGDIVSYGSDAGKPGFPGAFVTIPNEEGKKVTYILLDYKQLVWTE